jgi:hypothetical protein
MMKPERAIEIVRRLSEIEHEVARYYAGEDSDSVMEKLDVLIHELRDALWHEVPDVLATLMDQEEGIFRKIASLDKASAGKSE